MRISPLTMSRDWKKLTFYYFADSYINFNSLVTDLFKIYKTRIWMSAINPASFASPTLGLQAPSGIGPGAVGVGRSTSAAERRQPQSAEAQPAFSGNSGQSRPAQSTFSPPFNADRAIAQGSGYPPSNYPYNLYGSFGNAARQGQAYGPGVMPNMDSFASGFPAQGPEFAGRARYPSPPSAAQHDQGISPLATQTDWVGAFQGLSLNTR